MGPQHQHQHQYAGAEHHAFCLHLLHIVLIVTRLGLIFISAVDVAHLELEVGMP